MKKKTIQKRLTIYFITIALLVACLTGGIMYSILYSYYSSQENQFLENNALIIQENLNHLQFENESNDQIDVFLRIFSIILNTQLKLFDIDNNLLFDSGTPTIFSPLLFGENYDIPIFIEGGFIVNENNNKNGFLIDENIISEQSNFFFIEGHKNVNSTIEDDIVSMSAIDIPRSSKIIYRPILIDQEVVGYIELSNAPAYGRSIMNSIIKGWGIASIFAFFFTGIYGLWISKIFSKPIEELTETTNQMAQGDFSIRTNISQQDEIGELAGAFNTMANNIENHVNILRQFVADAAHEINTPLTALRANLELIGNNDNHFAIKQVDKMSQLANNLLNLSKLEAMDNKDILVTNDLVNILNPLLEYYASNAEAKGINFYVKIKNTPIYFLCNSYDIQILFSNLIDNAIKFTPKGGNVTVILDTSSESIRFTVNDTGIGIPNDDMNRLFSRFHRGKNTSSYEGNGLGLAIVKAISNKYKAKIKVTSDSKGSEFKITFLSETNST